MHVVSEINELRKVRWADPAATWGLVPTMGFLHEGHMALVRRAKAENDRVGVSIFVNPIQFNNPGDLEKYPRDMERDQRMLEKEGVDLLWAPTPDIVYPPGYQTHVDVSGLDAFLEGASRPGHFRGVTTVVAKLFNVFQPARAYFGQKDAQQVAIIRKMVQDLNFNLEMVACPIVREADGLAMSSRNVRLSAQQRREALCLSQALTEAEKAFSAGTRDAEILKSLMTRIISKAPLARIDYISIADTDTLEEVKIIGKGALVSMAVNFGEVRLIDNTVLAEVPHAA